MKNNRLFIWLLILIAYLPFQVALNLGGGFDLASGRVLVSVFFAVLSARFLRAQGVAAGWRHREAVGLGLFLAMALVSCFWAPQASWALRKWLFFVSLCPLYCLVVFLAKSRERIKETLSVLVWSGFALAMVGLAQFLAQFVLGLEQVYRFWAAYPVFIFSGFNFGAMINSFPSWLVNLDGITVMRAFSVFSDPHMFSFYLGMSLPAVISVGLASRRKIFFSVYLLMFAALLVSFTRGAYVAVMASTVFLVLVLWRYFREKAIAAGLALSLLVFIIPGTPVSGRFYNSFDLTDGSNLGRLAMWETAQSYGINNFWLGLGLGGLSPAVDGALGYRSPVTAHNLYLDIFSEMGVLGLAAFLWLILGVCGRIAVLFRMKLEQEKAGALVLAGVMASLVYFVVHSFFETALYHPAVFGLLLVILGLSSVLLDENKH